MIQDAWGWCTETTQRDGTGREEGGGSGLVVYTPDLHGNGLFEARTVLSGMAEFFHCWWQLAGVGEELLSTDVLYDLILSKMR